MTPVFCTRVSRAHWSAKCGPYVAEGWTQAEAIRGIMATSLFGELRDWCDRVDRWAERRDALYAEGGSIKEGRSA